MMNHPFTRSFVLGVTFKLTLIAKIDELYFWYCFKLPKNVGLGPKEPKTIVDWRYPHFSGGKRLAFPWEDLISGLFIQYDPYTYCSLHFGVIVHVCGSERHIGFNVGLKVGGRSFTYLENQR